MPYALRITNYELLKTCVYVEYIVEYFLCKVANLEVFVCVNISKTAEFQK